MNTQGWSSPQSLATGYRAGDPVAPGALRTSMNLTAVHARDPGHDELAG